MRNSAQNCDGPEAMGTKDIQPSVLTHAFPNCSESLRISENLFEKGKISAVLKATEIPKAHAGNGTDGEVPLIEGTEIR
jgi:[methyl-Co(III) methanol-specific corrinoid protein]:coenzyme M methyltransferase